MVTSQFPAPSRKATLGVPLTADGERVVRQAMNCGDGRWKCLCSVTSESGRNIIAARMGYAGADSMVWLTPKGCDKRSELIANMQVQLLAVREKLPVSPSDGAMIPLINFIRAIRTAWMNRPVYRLKRSYWAYRFRQFLRATQPKLVIPDLTNYQPWGERDEKAIEMMWRESNYLAFWLCPDGIDAGIAAHDEYLARCESGGEAIFEGEPTTPTTSKRHSSQSIDGVVHTSGDRSQYEVSAYNSYSREFVTDFYRTEAEAISRWKHNSRSPSKLPCGCKGSAGIWEGYSGKHKHDEGALCHTCGATWIPASNNVRCIASDEPDSLRLPRHIEKRREVTMRKRRETRNNPRRNNDPFKSDIV